MIAQAALDYRLSDEQIPIINYTKEETSVWQHCYPKLRDLGRKYACEESQQIMADFERNVHGCSADTIPQLDDISKYLTSVTGWRLKPVGGLLTQREFLNSLAFRIFNST